MDTSTLRTASQTVNITTHNKFDNFLCDYISEYLENHSFVKLEAALTQLVYEQFKPYYLQADESEKQTIEEEIKKHIPNRQEIKAYLEGNALCLYYLNTIANFFGLAYIFHNHNPAEEFFNDRTNPK